MNEEIEIKQTYFNAIKQINLFQESHFLIDRSNIIKMTFIEINKFLPIHCSESF